MQRNIDSVCHWQRKLYDTDRKDTLKYTGIGLSTTDYDMYYGMQLISLVGLPQTWSAAVIVNLTLRLN